MKRIESSGATAVLNPKPLRIMDAAGVEEGASGEEAGVEEGIAVAAAGDGKQFSYVS